jgi:hypothetical protein
MINYFKIIINNKIKLHKKFGRLEFNNLILEF